MVDPTPVTADPAKPAEKKESSFFANIGMLFKDAGENANLLKNSGLSSEMQMHLSMNYLMNSLKRMGMEDVFQPIMSIFNMFGAGPSEELGTKLTNFGSTMERLDKGNSKDFMTALNAELDAKKIQLASGVDRKTFIEDMTKFADKVYEGGLSHGEKNILQAKLADKIQAVPAATTTTTTPAPTTGATTTTPMTLTVNTTTTQPYSEADATRMYSTAEMGNGPKMGLHFDKAVEPYKIALESSLKPADPAMAQKTPSLLEQSLMPNDELRRGGPAVLMSP